MAMGSNVTGISALAEVLSERGLEGLGSAVEILINEAMSFCTLKHPPICSLKGPLYREKMTIKLREHAHGKCYSRRLDGLSL